MKKIILITLIWILFVGCFIAYADEYDANKICDAIYIIEGREEANQLYGINPQYIICDSEKECREICINSVENNKIRFKNQKGEEDYLIFLAKRYCPPNWVVWLKNLNFYLNK